MRRRNKLVVIGAVALVLAGTASIASAGGRPLSTAMSGAAEVPGPGDPDATGQADFTFNPGQDEICYDLSWANINGTVTAAHIHPAPAGVAGPVLVPLPLTSSAGTGESSGCVEVERATVKEIMKNGSNYYVNVHSTEFPAGAIRGQLGD
ncbi:MAG TPA: CHRD domain-containing protein [Acidimicrobiia bacterium]|jgi:hypothetical protein|nr:CHRD domain-containing protein [Acidimicrobiia bacterium]